MDQLAEGEGNLNYYQKNMCLIFSCFLFFLVFTEYIHLPMWIEDITLVPYLLFLLYFPAELITAFGTQ